MAQIFNAYIYGIDAPGGSTEIAPAGGLINGFSPTTVHIYPTTQVRGNAQVTCAAVIEVLPNGNNQISTKYYTAATVATLTTAANA